MAIEVGGAVGGLPRLAPDLTFPSDKVAGTANIKRVTGINAAGSLTTALSLTGKFSISLIRFFSLTAETITVKLTVDGEVKWNDTYTCTVDDFYLGGFNNLGNQTNEIYSCDSALLLEIQTATDTNISLDYLARPIL